jgi:hypothetical protein
MAPGDQPIPMSVGSRLNVRATSRDGRARLVAVRQRGADEFALEGRFVFPAAGSWTLRWSAFGDRFTRCAGLLRVRVRAR